MPDKTLSNRPSPHPKADNARANIDAGGFSKNASFGELNRVARNVVLIPNVPHYDPREYRPEKISKLIAGVIKSVC